MIALQQDDDSSRERYSRQALGIEQAIGERRMEAFAQTSLGRALRLARPTEAMPEREAALAIRRMVASPTENPKH